MLKTIYFYILLFCCIACQGIFATLSDKDTKLSPNSLVRNRRVINHLPGGRSSVSIEAVNYIVRIRENHRTNCAGLILSHYSVLTAAVCLMRYPHVTYDILSGSNINVGYTEHNITSLAVHGVNPENPTTDGIALVTIDYPFVFSSKTGSISLYTGPKLHPGTMVKVYGWGYIYPPKPRIESRPRLRVINLPIMDHAECQHVYSSHRINITENHICTYHAEQCCARNDEGAPLVFENKLVGIHIFKEEFENQKNPDVFIDLQSPDYKQWIIENTLLM